MINISLGLGLIDPYIYLSSSFAIFFVFYYTFCLANSINHFSTKFEQFFNIFINSKIYVNNTFSLYLFESTSMVALVILPSIFPLFQKESLHLVSERRKQAIFISKSRKIPFVRKYMYVFLKRTTYQMPFNTIIIVQRIKREVYAY